MFSSKFFNNYSLKWGWLVVDIYGDAKQRSKYPQLATDNEGTTVESRFFKSLRETEIDSNN